MSSSSNTPGEPSPDDFYDAAPLEPHLLYQGELLIHVPILNAAKPKTWLLLRTRSGARLDEALQHGAIGGTVHVLDANQSREQWNADNRGDFCVGQLDRSPALVLNQTCDIQNKDYLQIAPIYPAGPDPAHLERLKRGDIGREFWIKSRPPHIPTDSFADLELIQAIHKSYLRRITADQHVRLQPDRARRLQQAITRYFGRPNSFDSRSDQAPRSGTYLCEKCFYMDGVAQAIELVEGGAFPICVACGGGQWVLQGR